MMKKAILLIGLASVMSAFTGCSKDEAAAPATNEAVEYTLNTAIAGSTRTELDMSTLKLNWLAGDKIKIYTGNNTAFTEFTTADADGVFTGAAEPVKTADGSYVAVYPDGKIANVYDSDAGGPSLKLQVNIPRIQTYEAGRGPVDAIPMVALWGDGDQSALFRPVGSVLQLPVYATDATELESVQIRFTYNSSAGNVGVGNLSLKSCELDEENEYSDPTITNYYNRNSFLNSDITNTVTVNGQIALGTSSTEATNINAVVSPGDYRGGYTVTLTEAGGSGSASMVKKKAASTSLVALQPGKVQKIAPLEYVQKAPKFTLTHVDDVTTATLDAGQTLDVGYTYKYELQSYVYNSWQRASASVTIPETDYGTFKSVNISEITLTSWEMPSEGETMHFVIQATDAEGTVYTRTYEYIYHKPAGAVEVKFSEIYWDIDTNAALVYFSSGADVVKEDANNVEFTLSGRSIDAGTIYTMASELTGARWLSDWTGEYFSIPLTAFGLSLPITAGDYTLGVTHYEGFSELSSDTMGFEVY